LARAPRLLRLVRVDLDEDVRDVRLFGTLELLLRCFVTLADLLFGRVDRHADARRVGHEVLLLALLAVGVRDVWRCSRPDLLGVSLIDAASVFLRGRHSGSCVLRCCGDTRPRRLGETTIEFAIALSILSVVSWRARSSSKSAGVPVADHLDVAAVEIVATSVRLR